MPKTVFSARVLQKYRNPNLSWYGKLGHRGVDLDFRYEPLYSPISGTVVRIIPDPRNKRQTGQCILVQDAWGSIHVFTHMKTMNFREGQFAKRGEILGITGNTGYITSGPHLHYEVITKRPHSAGDEVMVRTFDRFKGYSTDPVPYDRDLYKSFNVPIP